MSSRMLIWPTSRLPLIRRRTSDEEQVDDGRPQDDLGQAGADVGQRQSRSTPGQPTRLESGVPAGRPGPSAAVAAGRRIPSAIVAATPDAEQDVADAEDVGGGHPRGHREDVGQERQRRVGQDDAVRVSRAQPRPTARDRLGDGRHVAAVGDDGQQVAAGPDGRDGHARDRDVAQHGGEDQQGRDDVDRRGGVAERRADGVR